MVRIPFMFIPISKLRVFAKKFYGIGEIISKFIPGLKYDTQSLNLDLDESEYSIIAILNALIITLIFSILVFLLSFLVGGRTFSYSLLLTIVIGLGVLIFFSYILLRYPKIAAGKKAERIEKNLIFALKDILLQVSSGIGLYNTIVIISKSNYGEVSKEFEVIAKKINTGMPIEKALEKHSIKTKSDYLKRTLWQLMNTIKAGASLRIILRTIIDELTNAQRTKISNYAKELNLWSLLYMLFAVAIPTIGIVILLILGSFAGFEITKNTFIAFLAIDFFIQIAVIGFIKSRRPIVQF